MNGLWSGEYRYPVNVPPVRFTAWFTETGGALTGTSLEPNTFAPTSASELGAALAGHRAGVNVAFAKIYDPDTGIVQPPVFYAGIANPAFTTVIGTWSFGVIGWPSGEFTLSRLVSAAAKAGTRQIAEPVGQN